MGAKNHAVIMPDADRETVVNALTVWSCLRMSSPYLCLATFFQVLRSLFSSPSRVLPLVLLGNAAWPSQLLCLLANRRNGLLVIIDRMLVRFCARMSFSHDVVTVFLCVRFKDQ